jgi:hypothetical protein
MVINGLTYYQEPTRYIPLDFKSRASQFDRSSVVRRLVFICFGVME